MDSLQDFFDDWEKQYSQQVDIPEVDMLKEIGIKSRRYSLDTQKLIENSKLRTAKAKARLLKDSMSSDQSVESVRDTKPSVYNANNSSVQIKIIENVPVKSDEFILENQNRKENSSVIVSKPKSSSKHK